MVVPPSTHRLLEVPLGGCTSIYSSIVRGTSWCLYVQLLIDYQRYLLVVVPPSTHRLLEVSLGGCTSIYNTHRLLEVPLDGCTSIYNTYPLLKVPLGGCTSIYSSVSYNQCTDQHMMHQSMIRREGWLPYWAY